MKFGIFLIFGLSFVLASDWSPDADRSGNIIADGNEMISNGSKNYNILNVRGGQGGAGTDGQEGGTYWSGLNPGCNGPCTVDGVNGTDGKFGFKNNGFINSGSVFTQGGKGGQGGAGGNGSNTWYDDGTPNYGKNGGNGGNGGQGGAGIYNTGTIETDFINALSGLDNYGNFGRNGSDATGQSGGGNGGKGGQGGAGGVGIYNTGTIETGQITTQGNGSVSAIINKNFITSKNNDLTIINNGTGIGIQNYDKNSYGIISANTMVLNNSQTTKAGAFLISGGKISVGESLMIEAGYRSAAIDDGVIFTDSKGNALKNGTLVLKDIYALGGGVNVSGFSIGKNGINTLKTYEIKAIAGSGIKSYGILNALNKQIFASIINTSGTIASGLYNLGRIQNNDDSNLNIIASGNGVGVENLGTIATTNNKSLFIGSENGNGDVVLNNGSKALIQTQKLILSINTSNSWMIQNTANATINAEQIILNGGNTIKNNGGNIATSKLILNNSNNIYGDISFDASKESFLEFDNLNFERWNSNSRSFYLNVINGNIILNSNTSVLVNFNMNKKQLLMSNLVYDTPYLLANGIIDNRRDKDKNVIDNFVVDGVSYSGIFANAQIDGKDFDLIFHKPTINFFPKHSESAFENSINAIIRDANKNNLDKVGYTIFDYGKQDVFRVMSEVKKNNKNADKILSSMIESSNFQNIAIDTGIIQALGRANRDGQIIYDYSILNTIVDQTNKTLAAAISNSVAVPLRISQYANEQIQNRINSLLLSRFSYSILLQDKVNDVSLEQLMKSMRQVRGNTFWANAGGAYYQGRSNNNLALGNISIGYDKSFNLNDESSLIVGGIFNYGYGRYKQDFLNEKTNSFTLGAYFQYSLDKNEIQGAISETWMLNNGEDNTTIVNPNIGINQAYKDTNTSLDFNLYYKYRINVAYNQRIKPFGLLSYTFISMPKQQTELFDIQEAKNNILGLGIGAEYIFSSKQTSHTIQVLGKYNALNTLTSRGITFLGSNTYIDYDLNLARMWFRAGYTGTLNLKENLSLNLSAIADVSNQLDFGVMGNFGIKWVF